MASFSTLDELRTFLLCRLDTLVPEQSSVAYFDYPVHDNVGDILIYLGTEEWFRERELRVLHRSHCRDWRYPALPSNVIVLAHGGGNWGDLYPQHQRLREGLCESYRDNPVVFLPQTVYFKNPATLRESVNALNRHSRLTVLVRDQRSRDVLEAANATFALHVVPDMATFLHPIYQRLQVRRLPRRGRLELLRQDVEKVVSGGPRVRTESSWSGDWRKMLSLRIVPLLGAYAATRFAPTMIPEGAFARSWHRYSRMLARHCAERFAAHELIVSSRLHGHILATLLGIPNELRDNSYGKNVAYYNQWHADLNQPAEGSPRT